MVVRCKGCVRCYCARDVRHARCNVLKSDLSNFGKLHMWPQGWPIMPLPPLVQSFFQNLMIRNGLCKVKKFVQHANMCNSYIPWYFIYSNFKNSKAASGAWSTRRDASRKEHRIFNFYNLITFLVPTSLSCDQSLIAIHDPVSSIVRVRFHFLALYHRTG